MPRRIIDGERTWRSQKLRCVQPESFRAEYTWLFALANDFACFECDPEIIHATCYAVVRPSVSLGDVKAILSEFERAKLLYRWKVGKETWGFWTGTDKPGLLPPPSQRSSKGPVPDPEELRAFLDSDNSEPSPALVAAYPETSPSIAGLGLERLGKDRRKSKTPHNPQDTEDTSNTNPKAFLVED